MARKGVEQEAFEEVIIENTLEDVMHNSMMPYAEHVIMDRALPRVEDGLKPVQRRILYTMHELKLTPDQQTKKCARIVGDCMGKYHPHGDSSVYDALVRLAQDFNMRMPLIEGQGNFGDVDGSPAAAMRYTEAKLTPLAMEMLRDLQKNTVDWVLNFDDSLKEPVILPSRFPNLLVNGTTGIAVGLATNIPPHNLTEVIDGAIEYIENPKMSVVQMMKIIKGPDFPTGGFITAGEELFNAYYSGRGKIKVRAKAAVEIDNQGKKSIVITELPYQVNLRTLLLKMAEMKDKKKELFDGIQEIVDSSADSINIQIKLKKDVNEKKIIDALFKYTDLETTFGFNMVAIVDGRPQQLGLIDLIRHYVNYQRTIVHKRTQFDLAAARARAHIVEGLVLATKHIDEIIKIIRASKNQTEAKQRLRERFGFSEKQVQAIIEMKLGQLTKLDATKLTEELASLKERIKEYEFILASPKNEFAVVKKELAEIKRNYKTERRSQIMSTAEAALNIPVKDSNVKEDKDGRFVVMPDNSFKLISNRSWSQASPASQGNTVSETVKYSFSASNVHNVCAFTNLGSYVFIDIDELEEVRLRSRGVTLQKVCKEALKNEYVVAAFDIKSLIDKNLYFYTAKGKVKRTAASEYNLNKKYYAAIVLTDDDKLIGVEAEVEGRSLLFATKSGMVLNTETDDYPLQGRKSAGVRGIQLADGDEVVFAGQAEEVGELAVITEKGFGKRVVIPEFELSKRARKGLQLNKPDIKSGEEVKYCSLVKEPYDIVFFVEGALTSFSVNTEDIPISARTLKPKDLIKNKEGNPISYISAHITK